MLYAEEVAGDRVTSILIQPMHLQFEGYTFVNKYELGTLLKRSATLKNKSSNVTEQTCSFLAQ